MKGIRLARRMTRKKLAAEGYFPGNKTLSHINFEQWPEMSILAMKVILNDIGRQKVQFNRPKLPNYMSKKKKPKKAPSPKPRVDRMLELAFRKRAA